MTFLLDDDLPWKFEESQAAFKPPEMMRNLEQEQAEGYA